MGEQRRAGETRQPGQLRLAVRRPPSAVARRFFGRSSLRDILRNAASRKVVRLFLEAPARPVFERFFSPIAITGRLERDAET